jgi:hypothetical protein
LPESFFVTAPAILTSPRKSVAAASLWRTGVAVLLVWFAIVDLLRKLLSGTTTLLAVTDILVFAIYITFFLRYPGGRPLHKRIGTGLPWPVWVAGALFGGIVIIQTFNPFIPVPLLGLAGLRTYVFYIAAALLGRFFLRSDDEIPHLFRFLLWLSIPLILLAWVQAIMDPSKLAQAFLSMDSNVHSFGNFEFRLIPSTFASSKRFGRFLVIVYPILYGLALYLGKSRSVRFGLFSLFMSAALISGSRDTVMLLLLFHVVMYVLLAPDLPRKFGFLLLTAAAAVVMWNTLLNFDQTTITEENYRLRSFFSSRSDWVQRGRWYVLDPITTLREQYSASELFWGTGAGTYGAETGLVGDLRYVRTLGLSRSVGSEGEQGMNTYGVTDAGVSRLVVELGMPGLAAFVCLYSFLLFALWRRTISTRRDPVFPLAASLLFVPIGWLALAAKAHNVLSDGMALFGVWFAIGLLLSLWFRVKTGRYPAGITTPSVPITMPTVPNVVSESRGHQ